MTWGKKTPHAIHRHTSGTFWDSYQQGLNKVGLHYQDNGVLLKSHEKMWLAWLYNPDSLLQTICSYLFKYYLISFCSVVPYKINSMGNFCKKPQRLICWPTVVLVLTCICRRHYWDSKPDFKFFHVLPHSHLQHVQDISKGSHISSHTCFFSDIPNLENHYHITSSPNLQVLPTGNPHSFLFPYHTPPLLSQHSKSGISLMPFPCFNICQMASVLHIHC
jgi:hypothetical protein